MKKIQEQLEKGRTISQYPTAQVTNPRYNYYFRWDDSKLVVNCKSIWALKRRGVEINIPIVSEIIK
jgi:hypothetical protein|tara:strand:+ start:2300 stop:2497 length:198 start_codon:yes stop_codon:yes gene_type:complete